MDGYKALVRSLVTERFTQWRPHSPSGNHVKCFGRTPPGDTPKHPDSSVRAQVHHDKSSSEARDVK
jgi:hypothetical protein